MTGPPQDDRRLDPLVEFAVRVLVPAGLLTAVLYYFGYTRAKAYYGHFGVDLGTIGFSTTDYLVHSAGALFSPLAAVLVALVAAVIVHYLLAHLLARVDLRSRRIVWAVLGGLALALFALGAVGLHRGVRFLTGPLISPVALGVGALLLEYATESARADGVVPERFSALLTSTRTLRRDLLFAVALLAAFWATANVAQHQGITETRALESSLFYRPQAIVYSHDRLQIHGAGVSVERLRGADSAYTFRYNGLRVLAHTGGRWFLLPTGWTRVSRATVILLPDSRNDIRVDLAP